MKTIQQTNQDTERTLVEITVRSLSVFIAFITVFLVSYEYSYELLYVLIKPLFLILKKQSDVTKIQFIFTDISESFHTHFKITVIYTILITIFFSISQLIFFHYSGNSKTINTGFYQIILIFSMAYVSLIYFVIYKILPILWHFFLSFEKNQQNSVFNIVLQARILNYINISLQIISIFTIIFLSFATLNIYTIKTGDKRILQKLRKNRRFIYVGVLFIAALLSPPDVLSQLLFSIPLFLCIELSILTQIFYEKYLEETGFEPALE